MREMFIYVRENPLKHEEPYRHLGYDSNRYLGNLIKTQKFNRPRQDLFKQTWPHPSTSIPKARASHTPRYITGKGFSLPYPFHLISIQALSEAYHVDYILVPNLHPRDSFVAISV